MKKERTKQTFTRYSLINGGVIALGATLISPMALASNSINGGIWFNYENEIDSDTHDTTLGDVESETLILYIDNAPDGKPYSLSAEIRFGTGAFTRPTTNSTGDNFGFHKLEIGYKLSDTTQLTFGKTAVPFGFKTSNFWPGDMLLAGYGDQMDVGAKLSSSAGAVSYNLGYFHADDWGATSTDTMDDNGHWGSSTTYRKVKTFVADASIALSANHKVGISAQSGKLQDLTGTGSNDPDVQEISGSHSATAVYYQGSFDALGVKAEFMKASRTLPEDYVTSAALAEDEFDSDRAFLGLSYGMDDFSFYLDATMAKSDDTDTVKAFAPGVSYNYGPGWLYLEFLKQDGWVGANNNVGEGHYKAAYFTVDYYF